MDRKIRILGIAPYEAMKTAMQKLAAQRMIWNWMFIQAIWNTAQK